jgi:hypothetical protein
VVLIALPGRAIAVGFVISEVMFEAVGGNNGEQWIELYNGSGTPVNLDLYSLGWGRNDYTQGTVQLSGSIAVGDTWLIGGPNLGSDNANLVPYDMVHNFSPDLRSGTGPFASGVGLFQLAAGDIDANSVPYHSVIYGAPGATVNLLDESGNPGMLDVSANSWVPAQSIEIDSAGSWWLQPTPTPDVTLASPEPTSGVMLGLGLVGLALRRRARLSASS